MEKNTYIIMFMTSDKRFEVNTVEAHNFADAESQATVHRLNNMGMGAQIVQITVAC